MSLGGQTADGFFIVLSLSLKSVAKHTEVWKQKEALCDVTMETSPWQCLSLNAHVFVQS